MSPPEVRLWNHLRRSPQGIRFRRQYAIGPYVADFYCPAAKLVIEVDGAVHDFAASATHDERRDRYISALGLRIIRIPAADVFAGAGAVADGLLRFCEAVIGPSTSQLR